MCQINNKKILVTGAEGFVGFSLAGYLEALGYQVIRTTRSNRDCGAIPVGDISQYDSWVSLLGGIDTVIHCAARAHVLNENSEDSLWAYRRSNVAATEKLLKACLEGKVKRFVYLSSAGVHGNNSNGRSPFSEDDIEAPVEPYAISKLEAEKLVKKLCYETNLDYVIIRPPLVYGPNSKGNFSALTKYVIKGGPLPSFAPKNRRSLVALNNLIDFLGLCADQNKSPNAANNTFLISDEEVVSTAELLNLLLEVFKKRQIFPPIPYFMMVLLAKIVGKSRKLERMFDSLEISSKKARSILGWTPLVTMRQQLDLIAKYDSNF